MKKKLFLHIGTHKTGSTSLQQFLWDHARLLRKHGIGLYRGQFSQRNHVELHLASMRYERDSFGKQWLCSRVKFDAAFTEQVAERVRAFIRYSREPRILFSAEGLSVLRHDDEINRLRTILDSGNTEATVILYLRDKRDYLRSYTKQLLKVAGRKPASDYWSALYVEQDTWLTDYDTLVAQYQQGFGAKNVIIIDYDEEMKIRGNVIPSFLNVLGIHDSDRLDTASYFLNTTMGQNVHGPSKRRGARAKRAWLRWLPGADAA